MVTVNGQLLFRGTLPLRGLRLFRLHLYEPSQSPILTTKQGVRPNLGAKQTRQPQKGVADGVHHDVQNNNQATKRFCRRRRPASIQVQPRFKGVSQLYVRRVSSQRLYRWLSNGPRCALLHVVVSLRRRLHNDEMMRVEFGAKL